jgi:hypothetical protein
MTKTRFTLPLAKQTATSGAEAFVAGAETTNTQKERPIARFPILLTDADFARLKRHCKAQERSAQYFVRKALFTLLDELDAQERGESS